MPSGTLTTATAGQSDIAVVQMGDVPWEIYVALRAIAANQRVRMLYDRGQLILASGRVACRDGSRIIPLDDVPWSVYVALRDLDSNDAIRMVYDQGALTLMSPSPFHERVTSLIGRLIEVWTEEHDIPIVPCGSTTFRREDLERGLEPDKCYYIQNEAAVRQLKVFPSPPPPPDLAVEIDITSVSDVKLSIYSDLGVPELWVWRKGQLRCCRWDGQAYAEQAESLALPGFPLALIAELMDAQFVEGVTAVVKRFRTFVQNQP